MGNVEEIILAQKGKKILPLTCSWVFANATPHFTLCREVAFHGRKSHERLPIYNKDFKKEPAMAPSLGICCIRIPDCAGRQGNSLQHRTRNKMPRDDTPNGHMLSWDTCCTWRRAATPGS